MLIGDTRSRSSRDSFIDRQENQNISDFKPWYVASELFGSLVPLNTRLVA